MNKENFKQLATDMLPLIDAMKEFLKKHEVDCIASVVLDAEGYISFMTHDSKRKMFRYKEGSPIVFEHPEEE